MSAAADEIARIEHELEILRSRYATFQRLARIAKGTFIGLATILTLVAMAYGLVRDPSSTAITAAFVVLICGAFYLTRSPARSRWIDVVSPGMAMGDRLSEATAIEAMIAEREKRLAELKARQA